MASLNGGTAGGIDLVLDSSGNLFGTRTSSGPFSGSVFELAHGSSSPTALATFNGLNGYNPTGSLVEDSSGNLFGTTSDGGPEFDWTADKYGFGTVFEVMYGSGAITSVASFNGTNGKSPNGLIMDSSGNLFGTTINGGTYNGGSVFEVRHDSGAITTLASFNGLNGYVPTGSLIEDSSGNLFGTTSYGGPGFISAASEQYGFGTVFEVQQGTDAITTLATFDRTNGRNPEAGLVEDSDGNLYGTTYYGGVGNVSAGAGYGTLFEIRQGSGTVKTLASFNSANGAGPNVLFLDKGNLFGTTQAGGANNDGTVFEMPIVSISPTVLDNGILDESDYSETLQATGGTGALTFSQTGGTLPPGLSLSSSGVLSGTPSATGTYAFTVTAADSSGVSGIQSFSVTINPGVAIVTATLPSWIVHQPAYSQTLRATGGSGSYTFSATGPLPSGLTLSSDGVLSGTPMAAGTFPVGVTATDTLGSSAGQIYTLIISPGVSFATYTLTTVADMPAIFLSGATESPFGVIEDSQGNLFANVALSGRGGVGEVPQGSGTLINIAPANGDSPSGDLIEDSSGNLFGTTAYGGYRINAGTVFEVQYGSNSITTLASFGGGNGSQPNSGVVEDSSGNLFGMTEFGGLGFSGYLTGDGTVFELPKGSQAITTLVTFDGTNGANPVGGLLEDSSGNLFGTTFQGGAFGLGTVFEVPAGSGTVNTLASFNGTNGYDAVGTLIEDRDGNLFGATYSGGQFDDGTVFEVRQDSGTITTLASFNPSSGIHPAGSLVLDRKNDLIGTTYFGGPFGGGTVFQVQQGSGTISTLAVFNYTNGALPYGDLFQDSSGDVFGITTNGGAYAAGTIFALTAGPASWTVNQTGYSQLFVPTGGTGALTFGLTAGTLPPGLTLNSAGVLSGTPTVAGSYSFTVTGSDSQGSESSENYTVTINPQVTIVTTSLANGTAGSAYSQTIGANGGTGLLRFDVTGALPNGLTLSNSGLLSGTPVSVGSYSFTVSATDAFGSTAQQSYAVIVSAGLFSRYDVRIVGSSTVQAGRGFLVRVQATDVYGNPVTNYSGPDQVIASVTPNDPTGSFPITVSINGSGLGLFLADLQHASSFEQISVADSTNTFTGFTPGIIVRPGPAARLAFSTQPASAPTGVVLSPVVVQITDLYGNVITSDSTDQVTLEIASGPGSFAPGSTTTIMASNGVATFNNLALVNPGRYTLRELVVGQYTGPDSAVFSIAPLQVLPGSFAGTPSGFTLKLNAPFLVNSMTPVLYGPGFGATGPMPSVTLTGPSGLVEGSLVVDMATNAITFVETDTASMVNNKTPILQDGTYTVNVGSSGATGFQALNSGGGYLDGLGTGMPGSGNYTQTFMVNAAAADDDVVWIPAVAEGPGQALNAPGKNAAGGGYPLYLNDSTGTVSSVQATLTYNPSLLTVTPTTTSTFAVTVPTAGTAVLQYSGPALAAGEQIPLGFLTASVPAGTTTNPTPYRAKDLLHLSNVSLNSGAISVVTSDALHLVAYVGDADGDGAYSSNDAVLITRALLSTDTGFTAYSLVDPVIVADTDGAGFIPADAALQINEAGVGLPTANLPIPPIPGNVVFQARVASLQPRQSGVQSSVSHSALDVWRLPGHVPPSPLDQVYAQIAADANLFADSDGGFVLAAMRRRRSGNGKIS